MFCNNRLLFTLRAEGGKEEEGVGVERERENKICCYLTSSRLEISQPSWGHRAVLSFHGRQNKGRVFFQEFMGKSSTYRNQKGEMCTREEFYLHFKKVLFLIMIFLLGPYTLGMLLTMKQAAANIPAVTHMIKGGFSTCLS